MRNRGAGGVGFALGLVHGVFQGAAAAIERLQVPADAVELEQLAAIGRADRDILGAEAGQGRGDAADALANILGGSGQLATPSRLQSVPRNAPPHVSFPARPAPVPAATP